jgi:putative SOS response-associated peptidase YedK
MERDSELPVFTILTKDAAAHVEHIHNRMPMIFRQDTAQEWLSQGQHAISVDNVVFEPCA